MSLVCCGLALGLLPQLFTGAVGAETSPEPVLTLPAPAPPAPVSRADASVRGLIAARTTPRTITCHFDSPFTIVGYPGSPAAAAPTKATSSEADSAPLDKSPSRRDVFKSVDQMPLFPGVKCGDIEHYPDRKVCAERALLKYVYKHVSYPKKALDRGVEGVAVVTFVVEPHGAISDVKLVRNPGAGIGKAVVKLVKQMAKDHPRWEPGLRKGKPVAVEFALPVKFKLEK